MRFFVINAIIVILDIVLINLKGGIITLKKNIFRKMCAAAVAMACVLNTSIVSQLAVAEPSVKYEFENGSHPNSIIPDSSSERYVAGASGDKFVFLENAGEEVSVNVSAETTGMYDIYLCYSAPYGSKINNLYINGVDQGQISFAEKDWTEIKLCSAKLNAGENEIGIKGSWGWTNLDYVRVEPAVLPSITGHDRTPSDPKATDSTKRVMAYLADNYGKHVLSGQQEIYNYGPHDFEYEFNYIKEKTGELPAIRGFDFLNCANILYGSEDGTVDRMIDWVNNKGGIVTASWHVTVPKNFANYNVGDKNVTWNDASYSVWADDDNGTHTKPMSDFDTAKVTTEGTKENEYYMACLEALAQQIKKLQDADVPLIFRPLHEAEGSGGETGSWFWWGKEGSKVYKDIWVLTYKTLTEKYNLHNIIWEWNSYAYESSANWYPGDEYVDIIAYDKYNCTVYLEENNWQPSLVHNDSAISGTFYNIVGKYNSKKMVAMAENDSIPTLTNLLEEKAAWLYFCPWYDGGSDNTNFLSNPIFNKVEDLKEIYQSDYCITLDELPDLKTYDSLPPTEPYPTTAPATEPTEPDPTEEPTAAPATEPPTSVSTVVVPTDTPTDEPDPTAPTDPSNKILAPEGVDVTKYGDVNLDEKVNIADAVKLSKYLVDPTSDPFTDVQLANANCAKDSYIDGLDSTLIVNYSAMLVKEDALGKPSE